MNDWQRVTRRQALAAASAGVLGATVGWSAAKTHDTVGVKLVQEYPHDPKAFCQGLCIEGKTLYEGTGHYGESQIRKVELKTGKVQKSADLHKKFFGEGICLWDDKIYQLTWKKQIALIYKKDSFEPAGSVRYAGEGWGLAHDGSHFIFSNGSSNLYFMDSKTFKAKRKISVRYRRRAVSQLNELEFIDGLIWANIWGKEFIACIDPKSGDVVKWINLTGLTARGNTGPGKGDRNNVLNGIAYDAGTKKIYVTGKSWNKLFEIEVQSDEK